MQQATGRLVCTSAFGAGTFGVGSWIELRDAVTAGQHRRGTDEVTRQGHHMLAVLVGEDLADAGLGAGLLALQPARSTCAGG